MMSRCAWGRRISNRCRRGRSRSKFLWAKRMYTMNVNMPNLNSATGSWIMNFAELHRGDPGAPHVTATDLSSPVPLRKVDPKYPPTLVADRVEGEVVLYAVIEKDGSVGRDSGCARS